MTMNRGSTLRWLRFIRLCGGGAVLGAALASAIQPHLGFGHVLSHVVGTDPKTSSQLFGATIGSGAAAVMLKIGRLF